MSQPRPNTQRVISPSTLPIFVAFFTWGFGTGAQQLGRPLYALDLTGSVLLAGVLVAANGIPRMFTGPITGYLTERLGRKPLVIMGAGLRGATNLGQFFAADYVTFLVLELIGQIGVAMWTTSSAVLISDVTSTATRGRVLALRQMSMRMGFVAGPLLGGLLAAGLDLRYVFLLNAVTKIIIVVVVLALVKETREERSKPAPGQAPAAAPSRRFSLEPFRDRSFVALAAATLAIFFAQAGILQALLPVHARAGLGYDEAAVGSLLSLAAVFAFVFAFPNGLIADRFGRKVSLVPGLLLLAVAAFALTYGDLYLLLALAVILQGTGEAMTHGTAQTYAMDLAPPESRGSFIGVWSLLQAIGATLGPLLLAGLYEFVAPNAAFLFLGALLIAAAVLMSILARETAGKSPQRTAG